MPNDKEIPQQEQWIHDNKEVMESLQKGMQQAREGLVIEKDFSEFAKDS